MIEEIRLMLGNASENFSDAQITLCLKWAMAEVEDYCNRELDTKLEIIAQKIAIIKLNRINTEGLISQSYSGISESYVDGLPADIQAVLNAKRRVKVV